MQLICIGSYLQSVLRYQFLTLDTSQPDNPYLREQDVSIRGYSSKPKGVGEQKCLGNPVLGRNTEHVGTFEACLNNTNGLCTLHVGAALPLQTLVITCHTLSPCRRQHLYEGVLVSP